MSKTAIDYTKEFQKMFNQLTYGLSSWQAWEHLMTVFACSISNVMDRREKVFERRKEEFEKALDVLGNVELTERLQAILIDALTENPDQDFLGDMYMKLNLGSHWHGQYFTPFNVCRMMAGITLPEDCQKTIEEQGYASMSDPCVGAGATLIAAASILREQGVNYQQDVIFSGQDIDPVVAKMAYIQLSLLGCSGYITIGDSLKNPQSGHPLFPIQDEEQEIWIMPMFFHKVWGERRDEVLKQLKIA